MTQSNSNRFVIAHKTKSLYLQKDNKGCFLKVTSISKADRYEYEKAVNIIANSLSPSERHLWQVICMDADDYDYICKNGNCYRYIATEFDNMQFDWVEKAKQQQNFFRNRSNTVKISLLS